MKANEYDISIIRKYLDGELDERAMYELERRAESDPQLMDVIRGMESADARTHDNNLAFIDRQLQERINKSKRRSTLLWANWRVAASLFFALTAGTWWLINRPEKEHLAQNPVQLEQKKEEQSRPTDKQPVEIAKKPITEQKTVAAQPETGPIKEIHAAPPLAANAKIPKARQDISLSEVTVVGYAPTKKADLTSSVTATSDNINDSSVSSEIAGRVGGINVSMENAVKPGYIEIRGRVVDKTDNSPLPGVMVRGSGTAYAIRTDADGNFSISLPDSVKALNIAAIGFEQQQVKVKKGKSAEIEMEPNKAALSEVVVVGYSKAENPAEARPAIGWRAYRKYLEKNATSPDGNTYRVTVEFTVEGSGAITGLSLQEPNESLKQKANDLIQKGPSWQGRRDGNSQKIILQLKFKNHHDD